MIHLASSFFPIFILLMLHNHSTPFVRRIVRALKGCANEPHLLKDVAHASIT